MTTSIETFFASWGMADAQARLTAIKAVTNADTTYVDPRTTAPLTGSDSIAQYVAMFAQAAPGATATVVKSDTQNGLIRATIEFRMTDGMTQLGQYFIAMNDSTIASMTGFVGTGAPQ